ncbi:MAG TPA: DUF4160 domain-containing protein [Tichowtungia sp.]|nr:DUF4160 domain-containing protein [Tichowtungia sp.]
MSPTLFRVNNARFYFFTREEPRIHIHVQTPDGEAKFWIEPEIELAGTIKLKQKELNRLKEIVIEHQQEIINEWKRVHKR